MIPIMRLAVTLGTPRLGSPYWEGARLRKSWPKGGHPSDLPLPTRYISLLQSKNPR